VDGVTARKIGKIPSEFKKIGENMGKKKDLKKMVKAEYLGIGTI